MYLLLDLLDIEASPEYKLAFPDPNDKLHFTIMFTPTDGMYVQGKFLFEVEIPRDYPHSPPKLLCKTSIYHPNIDRGFEPYILRSYVVTDIDAPQMERFAWTFSEVLYICTPLHFYDHVHSLNAQRIGSPF